MHHQKKRLKTNEYQREYRRGHKTFMEFAINRFHEIVSQGPLYVCTCCDQLWYKHSVAVPISSGSQNLTLLNIY